MPGKHVIRYFFVNLLCILMPLVIVGSVVTQKLVSQMKIEENRKLTMQMEEVVTAWDNQFQSFRLKSIALFSNDEFSSGKIFSDPNSAREAIRLLNSLKQFDTDAEEMVVYYGEGYLYSVEGRVSPGNYLSLTLACNPESKERGLEVLASEEYKITVLHSQIGNIGYLMYHVPAGEDYRGYRRSVEIFVSFSRLASLLNRYLQNTGVLLELNVNGDKIYFHYTEHGCDFVMEKDAALLLEQYESELRAETVTDPDTTVRLLFDEKEQFSEFYTMRNLYILLMLVGVSLSFLLSVRLSKNRSAQVEVLIDNIRKNNFHTQKSKRKPKDEFDYIQSVLDESIVENRVVKENAHKYRRRLLEQASMLIFHGLLRERDEIQSLLKICGTELLEEYFFLCGVQVENKEKLGNLLQADLHCFYKEGDTIYGVILCELSHMDPDMGERHEIALRFRQVMKNVGVPCGQVVMSQVYSQISMANYAYLEVLSILKHMPEDFGETVCWEEWTWNEKQTGIQEYYNEDFKSFHEALTRKNERQAALLFKRIMKQKGAFRENSEEIRYRRYMIMQELLLEVRMQGDTNQNQQLLSEITNMALDDVPAFEAQVRHILKEFCQEKEDTEKEDEIVRFVEEHYLEYDFSLEKVALYMGISKGQMSKLFQARTGLSYIEYLTHLRMEKAKELLTQTDKSVKEIFMTVGYVDVVNASRKFRNYYGINPSAYREQMKQQKEEDTAARRTDEHTK